MAHLHAAVVSTTAATGMPTEPAVAGSDRAMWTPATSPSARPATAQASKPRRRSPTAEARTAATEPPHHKPLSSAASVPQHGTQMKPVADSRTIIHGTSEARKPTTPHDMPKPSFAERLRSLAGPAERNAMSRK